MGGSCPSVQDMAQHTDSTSTTPVPGSFAETVAYDGRTKAELKAARQAIRQAKVAEMDARIAARREAAAR